MYLHLMQVLQDVNIAEEQQTLMYLVLVNRFRVNVKKKIKCIMFYEKT